MKITLTEGTMLNQSKKKESNLKPICNSPAPDDKLLESAITLLKDCKHIIEMTQDCYGKGDLDSLTLLRINKFLKQIREF